MYATCERSIEKYPGCRWLTKKHWETNDRQGLCSPEVPVSDERLQFLIYWGTDCWDYWAKERAVNLVPGTGDGQVRSGLLVAIASRLGCLDWSSVDLAMIMTQECPLILRSSHPGQIHAQIDGYTTPLITKT